MLLQGSLVLRRSLTGLCCCHGAGDRYLLKLFRDFVFHQASEDGAPQIDYGHIVEALNKLDAGVSEQLLLLSRDEASMLVVSYADIKVRAWPRHVCRCKAVELKPCSHGCHAQNCICGAAEPVEICLCSYISYWQSNAAGAQYMAWWGLQHVAPLAQPPSLSPSSLCGHTHTTLLCSEPALHRPYMPICAAAMCGGSICRAQVAAGAFIGAWRRQWQQAVSSKGARCIALGGSRRQ